MSGRASDTYRPRVAAGLCRDCGGPRVGAGATPRRCGPCAERRAAAKRLVRALATLRRAFEEVQAAAQATRPVRHRPLRLARGGRERFIHAGDTSRLVSHEELLRALLAALQVHVPPRRRRKP